MLPSFLFRRTVSTGIKKTVAEDKPLPRPYFSMFPLLSAQKAPSVSSIVDLLACALGKTPAPFVLPSQFPNGRLTPRTTDSCTYSNGICSGLQPDFLIPASARKRTVFTWNTMQLIPFLVSRKRIARFFRDVNGLFALFIGCSGYVKPSLTSVPGSELKAEHTSIVTRY